MNRLSITLCCGLTMILSFSGTARAEQSTWVAKVNDALISPTDVAYKIKVENLYGNQAITDELATIALVNDAIEHEVARKAGVAPTVGEIVELEKFADATSKAPELLKQVKESFGTNRADYHRLFLAPRISNRKLRAYYSTTPELHQEQRTLIEKVHAGVLGGKEFSLVAQAVGLKVLEAEITNKAVDVPDAIKQYQGNGEPSQKDPLLDLLAPLPVGTFFPNIVEDDSCYRVIFLKSKDKESCRIEYVSVTKKPFETWYGAERAKLSIVIASPERAATIKKNYPGLGW